MIDDRIQRQIRHRLEWALQDIQQTARKSLLLVSEFGAFSEGQKAQWEEITRHMADCESHLNNAFGNFDQKIGDLPYDLTGVVFDRLNDICHLYNGLHFTSRGLIIAMYQSIMFLNKIGYTVSEDRHKGALTGWMAGIITEYSRGHKGMSYALYDSPVHNLTRLAFQQRFWARHYKTVINLLDIDLTDKDLPILDIA